MDEALWFTQPKVTFFSIAAGTAAQIAEPNARRIGLIIALANANILWASPDPSLQPLLINTIQGMAVTQGNPFNIVQSAFGNLVQVAWFGATLNAGALSTGVVIESLLREWPNPKRNGQCEQAVSKTTSLPLSQQPTLSPLKVPTVLALDFIRQQVEALLSQMTQTQSLEQGGL
jgi:hypothetical protein